MEINFASYHATKIFAMVCRFVLDRFYNPSRNYCCLKKINTLHSSFAALVATTIGEPCSILSGECLSDAPCVDQIDGEGVCVCGEGLSGDGKRGGEGCYNASVTCPQGSDRFGDECYISKDNQTSYDEAAAVFIQLNRS